MSWGHTNHSVPEAAEQPKGEKEVTWNHSGIVLDKFQHGFVALFVHILTSILFKQQGTKKSNKNIYMRWYILQWLILIVKLTVSKITKDINLRLYLWVFIQIRLTDVRPPALNVGTIIPWPGDLDWIKWRIDLSTSIHLSLLSGYLQLLSTLFASLDVLYPETITLSSYITLLVPCIRAKEEENYWHRCTYTCSILCSENSMIT